MTYDNDYIKSFRECCHRLNLIGSNLVDKLTDDEIKYNINGVGCESMPSILRTALDSLHPSMIYPSHIHDLQWTFLPQDDFFFFQTNQAFQYNAITMAKDMHPWISPLRYWAIHKAKQFRRLLDKFGKGAFLAAHGSQK